MTFFDLLLLAKFFLVLYWSPQRVFYSGSLEGVCELMKFHCINKTKPKLAIQEIEPEENKDHVSIQRKRLTAAIFPLLSIYSYFYGNCTWTSEYWIWPWGCTQVTLKTFGPLTLGSSYTSAHASPSLLTADNMECETIVLFVLRDFCVLLGLGRETEGKEGWEQAPSSGGPWGRK